MPPTESLKAGRREWIGLAVLGLPCLLYSMDLTVLNLAVPRLTADLKPSAAQLLWIVDIYGFLVAGSLITMGTLGDRIGRRRLLMIGAVAFGAASVFAAFSTSAAMLIVARAVLGVAAATLAPSTLSLLRNMFEDPRERTVAIGLWITSFSAGGAIGPLVGGVLLQYFWWGSVFLVALPVMALLLVLAPVLLPEFKDPKAGRLDLTSAALSLLAVLATIFGIKQMAAYGLGLAPLVSIAVGLLVGALFLRRQMALADPLIDLGLFRVPAFSASLAINVFAFFAFFASFLMVAQFLQLVIGLSALEAGLWSTPPAFAFILGAQLTPRFAHKTRPAFLLSGGLIVAAAGFALLAQAGAGWPLATLVAGMIGIALGLAPVFTLTTDLIVGTAPAERAGAAAAIAETSSEFGGALGIAVLGSVVTAIYRALVADTLPAGLPRNASEAARDTLGGALAAAGEIVEPLATGVAAAARDAYVHAFAFASTISALMLVGVAVLALAFLRGLQPSGEAEKAPECLDAEAACVGV